MILFDLLFNCAIIHNMKTIYFYLIITIKIVEWGDFYEK